MANRIPRNATKLDVTFTDYAMRGNLESNHMIATKDVGGWHGIDDNGKAWSLLVQHLRNSDFCTIKVLA